MESITTTSVDPILMHVCQPLPSSNTTKGV